METRMKAFTDHPSRVGESYVQHMSRALGFGVRMVAAGLGCIVHAIFPFLCERTGSAMIDCLHSEMQAVKSRCEEVEAQKAA